MANGGKFITMDAKVATNHVALGWPVQIPHNVIEYFIIYARKKYKVEIYLLESTVCIPRSVKIFYF